MVSQRQRLEESTWEARSTLAGSRLIDRATTTIAMASEDREVNGATDRRARSDHAHNLLLLGKREGRGQGHAILVVEGERLLETDTDLVTEGVLFHELGSEDGTFPTGPENTERRDAGQGNDCDEETLK
jgi:hypothetical protein